MHHFRDKNIGDCISTRSSRRTAAAWQEPSATSGARSRVRRGEEGRRGAGLAVGEV